MNNINNLLLADAFLFSCRQIIRIKLISIRTHFQTTGTTMNNINNLLLADELGWNKKNNKKYKNHKLIDLQSVVLLVPHVPLLITVVSAL